jgi:hypothetical protein
VSKKKKSVFLVFEDLGPEGHYFHCVKSTLSLAEDYCAENNNVTSLWISEDEIDGESLRSYDRFGQRQL